MRWEQRITHASRTDIGMRRQNNEDNAIVRLAEDPEAFDRFGHLFVVADGMGGHAVGELASKLAVDTVAHLTFLTPGQRSRVLKEAIHQANATVFERGSQNRDFERMGTTCTAMSLSPQGLVIGHIGDSRAYRVRRDRVDQLTFDHSVEWELKRRHPGKVTPELLRQHKNVITRSLGPEKTIKVDIEGPVPTLPGDRYLLCSDGLTGLVTDEELGTVVRVLRPKDAARLLVDLANLRGGNDNCTVIVVEIGELPHGVPLAVVSEPDGPGWTLPWGWFAGWTLVAILIVIGVFAWVSGNVVAGILLTLLGGSAMIPVTVGTMRHRERSLQVDATDTNDDSRTMRNRPHATAVAMPLTELLEDLQSATVDLSAAAQDDGWPLDWTKYDDAVAAAAKAVEDRRLAVALREQGKAIHLLMRGLQTQRAAAKG